MSELRDLYQEVILDHGRRPRHFGPMAAPSHQAEGYNPLCGDRITVHLKIDGDVISDVTFEGRGCAISTASASLMAESLIGRSTADIGPLFDGFHDLVTGETGADGEDLGKLAVFGGVREFPMRVKCATLAWHTLKAALEGADAPATTE